MEAITAMTDVNQECSLGGFGARLKAAREALNLSQKDAAVRLHLNSNILQILESENFQKAPPATFMRGYLRSYARLLNFSEEDVSAALTQSGLASQTSVPVVPTLRAEPIQVSDRYVQWVSTAVVLGLFVFVGVWWGLHSSTSSNNTIARSTSQTPQPAPIAQPTAISQSPQVATTITTAIPTPTTPDRPVAATTPPGTSQSVAASAAPPATPGITSIPATQPAATSSSPVVPPAAVTANTAMPPPPAATTPTVAGAPLATTNIPAAPGTDPLAITTAQPNTTVTASTDAPKKRNRRHRQDSNVSGFAMELPEPGL